jgi:hypothetical protein
MALTSGELSGNPQWIKITKSYTDFSTASLTNTIDLVTLPNKSVIHNCIIKHSTRFLGGIIATYTISVGITGTLAKYAIAYDVNQVTGATVSGINSLIGYEFTGITLKATAISTVGLLNAATQGSVDIYVLVSILS